MIEEWKRKKLTKATAEEAMILPRYQDLAIQLFKLGGTNIESFIKIFNQHTRFNNRSRKQRFNPENIAQNLTCESAAIISSLWWNYINSSLDTGINLQAYFQQDCTREDYWPHVVFALLEEPQITDQKLLAAYHQLRSDGSTTPKVHIFHLLKDKGLLVPERMTTSYNIQPIMRDVEAFLTKVLLYAHHDVNIPYSYILAELQHNKSRLAIAS